MNFKLNCSPHLRMHEITKKLFNHNFLSDIRFCVGDKTIYAHSLELMKRSVVFEHELEDTWGEKKIIPITDCSYGSFYEFVRFIYTDECDINEDNGMDLLKLAIKYKIIMLENRVINLLASEEWSVQLFEYCVIEKYEMAQTSFSELFAVNFGTLLNTKKYLSLHQDALTEALQFDQIREGVTEVQIFTALARWIDNYCKQHQMSLTQGRKGLDHLIKKIRFPTMTNDEIRGCVKNYPGILTDNDFMSLGKQLFGCDEVNNLWNSQPRTVIKDTIEWRETTRDTPFVTTFTVSKDTVLHGIRIGGGQKRKEVEIEIKSTDIKTLKGMNVVFTQSAPEIWPNIFIALGDSLKLIPNYIYTITIKYLEIADELINIRCRKVNIDLMLNDPENAIRTMEASGNMLQMFFKSPPE